MSIENVKNYVYEYVNESGEIPASALIKLLPFARNSITYAAMQLVNEGKIKRRLVGVEVLLSIGAEQ